MTLEEAEDYVIARERLLSTRETLYYKVYMSCGAQVTYYVVCYERADNLHTVKSFRQDVADPPGRAYEAARMWCRELNIKHYQGLDRGSN